MFKYIHKHTYINVYTLTVIHLLLKIDTKSICRHQLSEIEHTTLIAYLNNNVAASSFQQTQH